MSSHNRNFSWPTRIIRFSACLLLITAGLDAAIAAPDTGDQEKRSEGRVRFYNIADSDFDTYSSDPSTEDQAWMRTNYARMQVYTSFFAERVRWFPNAWFYKDSYAIKPSWDIYRDKPHWVLRDASDRQLFIPWGCEDGTCPQYAGDFGNPAFRAFWIAEAREEFERGYRGIWVDDVNMTWRVSDGDAETQRPIDPRTGREMTLADWRRYFADFMEEIRLAFPDKEIAHNAIWFAADTGDAEVRRQILAADYINLERGAADRGLTGGTGRFSFHAFLGFIDAVHELDRSIVMMDEAETVQEREFGLAAYLLVSNGKDLLSNNQLAWTAPGSLWRGYQIDLGRAKGPRYESKGLLLRDFECGTVLLNPPDAPTRFAEPSLEARYIDGRPVEFVTLRSRSAAVLEHDCR